VDVWHLKKFSPHLIQIIYENALKYLNNHLQPSEKVLVKTLHYQIS